MKKIAKSLTFLTWIILLFLIVSKKNMFLEFFVFKTSMIEYGISILILTHLIFSILILPCSALTIIYGALAGIKYGFILCFFTSYISSLITYKLASTKFNPFIFNQY